MQMILFLDISKSAYLNAYIMNKNYARMFISCNIINKLNIRRYKKLIRYHIQTNISYIRSPKHTSLQDEWFLQNKCHNKRKNVQITDFLIRSKRLSNINQSSWCHEISSLFLNEKSNSWLHNYNPIVHVRYFKEQGKQIISWMEVYIKVEAISP